MPALQFTPLGVRPVVESLGIAAGDAVHAGGAAFQCLPEPEPFEFEAPPVARRTVVAAVVAKKLEAINPRSVVKATRERVKEIRAELRRMRGLEKELAQLERMLAAAKKSPASLTHINSRRAG